MRLYKIFNESGNNITAATLFVAFFIISIVSIPVSAFNIDDSIEKVLKFGQDDAKYGQIKFNLLYRYEYSDTQETAPIPAHGNTFRLRLGYLTPEFFGIQGFAEYENLYAAQNDYNGVVYGDSNHHVIADPADRHELNQLWLSYKGISDTVIIGGRQRIKLDDDRFIGDVGWRQMEQTYDSVIVTNQSINNMTAKAGYIGRVKNILSTTDNMEAPFVNIGYKLGDYGSVTSYGYWLKFTDDKTNFGKSSQSYGLRFTGSPMINEDLKFHYLAEYSYQEDYANNPIDYDAHRFNLMVGATAFGITAKGAIERLGGDGRIAFNTPLGTNHVFQGWADRFVATPADGVRDINFSLSGTLVGTKMIFVYHYFQDDVGSFTYGNEYDFLVKKQFGKHYHVLAKYAYYDGDSSAPGLFKNDTQKIWVQAGVNF